MMKTLGIILLIVIGVGWVLFEGDETNVEQEGGSRSVQNKQTDTVSPVEPVSTSQATGELLEIYDGISVPIDSKEVNLSGRRLSGSLKAEVRLLTKLEVLNISNNDFTGLPAEVGQLTNLRVLNLSNNPFTGLPYELGNLNNLETLDLRGTNYATQDLGVISQSLPSSVVILTE